MKYIKKWISINDKFPLEGELVLGVDTKDPHYIKYYLCYVNNENEWYPEDQEGLYSFPPELNISHWMNFEKFK